MSPPGSLTAATAENVSGGLHLGTTGELDSGRSGNRDALDRVPAAPRLRLIASDG
jgi:hypothetical protein